MSQSTLQSQTTVVSFEDGKLNINFGNMSYVYDVPNVTAEEAVDNAIDTLEDKPSWWKYANRTTPRYSKDYSNLPTHDLIDDDAPRIIRCLDNGCPSNLCAKEADTVWTRFYNAGLIGKTSAGRLYIADPAKEAFKKSPIFAGIESGIYFKCGTELHRIGTMREDGKCIDWKNLNKIFGDLWKNDKNFKYLPRQDYVQKIAHLKGLTHKLFEVYKELMVMSHPGKAVEVMTDSNYHTMSANKFYDHWDNEYDYRKGSTSRVCPMCGSSDLILEPNGAKNIKHECMAVSGTVQYDGNSDTMLSKDAQRIGAQGYHVIQNNADTEDEYLVKHGDFIYVHISEECENISSVDENLPKAITLCDTMTFKGARFYRGDKTGRRGVRKYTRYNEVVSVCNTNEDYIKAYEEREAKRRDDRRELFIDSLKEQSNVKAFATLSKIAHDVQCADSEFCETQQDDLYIDNSTDSISWM